MNTNEKRTPHYSLDLIKVLIQENKYTITRTALDNARCDFDLKSKEVINEILKLNSSCFYKSMTSNYDYKIWQDVYHLQISKDIAYIKLQIVSNKSVVIQFKRK